MSTVIKTLPKGARFSTLSQLRSQIISTPVDAPGDGHKNEQAKQYQFSSLSKVQIGFLERVIRVDQAGELGANYIYAGQYAVLSRRDPHLKDLIKHMWEQEIHHHNTFNALQVKHRVRPSLITPLWKVGAYAMGVGTALLSKEAAMACTVAVETVIGGHYNDQLRVLSNKFDVPARDLLSGETVTGVISEELQGLKQTIKTFRDDELEHLDTAVEHDAEKAVPYWLLTEAIKVTCKAAIWTAERV